MNRPAAALAPDSGLDFEALTRETYASVLAYLKSRIRHPDVAQDLAQETYLQAYRDRSRFDPTRGEPIGWILGIARNVSASWARNRGRHARELPRLEALSERPWPHESDSRLEALDHCLSELGGRSREILRLMYETGSGTEEISRQLEMGRSAVKVAALRARQALSECVRRRLEGTGDRP